MQRSGDEKSHKSTHVVDDIGSHPDLGVGRRLHDGAQLGAGNEVGGGRDDSSGGRVGLRRGPGVRVDLRAGGRSSESVLDSRGAVDDLGGHPDACGRDDTSGSHDLRLRPDVGHRVRNRSSRGNRRGHGHGLEVQSVRIHSSQLPDLLTSVIVFVTVITSVMVWVTVWVTALQGLQARLNQYGVKSTTT